MTGPLFSTSNAQEFGAFYHYIGLVQHSLNDDAVDAMRRSLAGDHSWRNDRAERDIIETAYRSTSLFHEMRHVVDAYGTMAGMSLFGGYMALLKDYCAELDILKQSGATLPLTRWVMEPNQPQERRDFVRRARAFTIGAKLFLGTYDPVAEPGHNEELLVSGKAGNGPIDAFPLRILLQENGELTPMTVYSPVGFEVFMEGNAHALARSMVDRLFPEFVADDLLMAIHAVEDDPDTDAGFKAHAPPYMIADLLISRFLRHRGVDQFPRDIVIALCDIAMSLSIFRLEEVGPGLTGARFESLGRALIETLEMQDVDRLAKGEVVEPTIVTDLYKQMLGSLEQGGDWDTVPDDNSPLASVMIWESYVAQHFTVPLLKARLESNHHAFRSVDGFFDLLSTIITGPVLVTDKGVSADMPKRVFQAWGHVTMLASLFQQLVDGRSMLRCPRRFNAVPGIDHINFSMEGHCSQWAALGCGTYEAGVFAASPTCLFENALQKHGFTR